MFVDCSLIVFDPNFDQQMNLLEILVANLIAVVGYQNFGFVANLVATKIFDFVTTHFDSVIAALEIDDLKTIVGFVHLHQFGLAN